MSSSDAFTYINVDEKNNLEHKQFFYINGQLHEDYYIDISGHRQGKYFEYDESGKTITEATYKDGLLHGTRIRRSLSTSLQTKKEPTEEYYLEGKIIYDENKIKALLIKERFGQNKLKNVS